MARKAAELHWSGRKAAELHWPGRLAGQGEGQFYDQVMVEHKGLGWLAQA